MSALFINLQTSLEIREPSFALIKHLIPSISIVNGDTGLGFCRSCLPNIRILVSMPIDTRSRRLIIARSYKRERRGSLYCPLIPLSGSRIALAKDKQHELAHAKSLYYSIPPEDG